MQSNHKVNVVRIKEILPHNNADTLGLVQIDGYQVVVKKDDFKVGDLAVYIQPDSVVPQTEPFKFIWEGRSVDENGNVADSKRRITVRKFRGEWSEGLLMPLWFKELEGKYLTEGTEVSEVLGITRYEEPEPSVSLGTSGRKPTLLQRILRFFGFKVKPFGPKNAGGVYDVESLKNYPRVFEEGEEVIVTEKIHGSNARYIFDGKKFYAGSHNRWCKDKNNIWWEVANKFPWIEEFCREWPGFTLRGEVTPTQKGYPYGFETEKQFFVFDLQRPDGSYVNKDLLYRLPGIQRFVPVVYQGPYNAKKMKELAEGNSLVDGAKNIREGIVISSIIERNVRGVGRALLKLKSLKFLEKETK